LDQPVFFKPPQSVNNPPLQVTGFVGDLSKDRLEEPLWFGQRQHFPLEPDSLKKQLQSSANAAIQDERISH
jgi:hypothetical protein